jgi:hypothetical protein
MSSPTGWTRSPVNNLSELNQQPAKFMGVKAPDGFMGSNQTFFQGATGLVATSFGIAGVTIGRLRTGVYGVKHPPIEHLQIWPSIQTPSGLGYQVAIKGLSGTARADGVSGYFEVHITRNEQAPVVTTTNPSTLVMHQNPPTGTVLDLLWYGSPIQPSSLGY